jgi:4-amino-4-deoxy-L-arabinose transferase-like glycosyltransferase
LSLSVLVVALVARATWALLVPVVPESDCAVYEIWARNLALGNGFSWGAGRPSLYLPVGASFVYSLSYRFFGFNYAGIVITNATLGVACVAFTMGLARRWFGQPAGCIAGLMLALWPSQIEFTTTLATEPPFMFFMLAGWYFYSHDGLPSLAGSVIAGLLFGAASYIRPVGILMPAILAIPAVFSRRRLLEPILHASVASVVIAIVLMPWAVRNKRTFGEYALSAHGKLNLWMGNHPGTDGLYAPAPPSTYGMTELERDHYLGAIAMAYIRENPAQFVGRSLVKFVRLHERESIGITWNLTALNRVMSPAGVLGLKILSNLYWWTALALGLGGIVMLARSEGILATLIQPAVLVWGYFAVTHAIIVISDRYHMPCIPSIAALGGYFMARRFPAVRARIASSHLTSSSHAE